MQRSSIWSASLLASALFLVSSIAAAGPDGEFRYWEGTGHESIQWCEHGARCLTVTKTRFDVVDYLGTRFRDFEIAPDGRAAAVVRLRKTAQATECSIEIYQASGRRTLRSPYCNPNNVEIGWTPHGYLLVGYGAGMSVSANHLYGADGRALWTWDGIGSSTSPSRRYMVVMGSTNHGAAPDYLDVVDLGTRRTIRRLPLGEQGRLQWTGSSLIVQSARGRRVLKLERTGVRNIELLT